MELHEFNGRDLSSVKVWRAGSHDPLDPASPRGSPGRPTSSDRAADGGLPTNKIGRFIRGSLERRLLEYKNGKKHRGCGSKLWTHTDGKPVGQRVLYINKAGSPSQLIKYLKIKVLSCSDNKLVGSSADTCLLRPAPKIG
jgi:hypothetical protein